MKIEVNQQGKLQLPDLSKSCYFCGFDKIVHQHHIIPKSRGGIDEPSNLIPLCPNCHAVIHKRLAHLQFSNGYFFMIYPERMMSPSEDHRRFVREAPYHSIKNARKAGKIKVDSEVDNAYK